MRRTKIVIIRIKVKLLVKQWKAVHWFRNETPASHYLPWQHNPLCDAILSVYIIFTFNFFFMRLRRSERKCGVIGRSNLWFFKNIIFRLHNTRLRTLETGALNFVVAELLLLVWLSWRTVVLWIRKSFHFFQLSKRILWNEDKTERFLSRLVSRTKIVS